MSVSEEIRSVKRPKNTIVEDRGRDGPKRYAVRERGVIKYIMPPYLRKLPTI